MSTHKNRVKMTVSGTPGTGTITLSVASSGYQSFATAYAANATVDILIEEGTAWEVARDCTYTNSGTTVTRGTLEASSTGSAVSFTSAAVVSVIATADRGRSWDAAALNTQVAGTDADTTMAINTLYVVDMSAWATADRTYTLPATAAVGDRIGVMVTAGDASHELVITAASGDTLNGIAGGTEWSRLFITNEVVIMRCIVANTTWVVEVDGRIAQNGSLTRTTTQTLGSGAFTKILGATIELNKGDCVDTTNSILVARRAGNYLCGAFCRLDLNATRSIVVGLGKNGTVVSRGQGMSALTPGAIGVGALCPIVLAAGDTLDMQVYHDQGANRDTSTVSDSVPRVYFTEIL